MLIRNLDSNSTGANIVNTTIETAGAGSDTFIDVVTAASPVLLQEMMLTAAIPTGAASPR
jgi:hypothetical protein